MTQLDIKEYFQQEKERLRESCCVAPRLTIIDPRRKKHEIAIYEGDTVDDWTSAVMLLREWADYTRQLEEERQRFNR